MLFIRKQKVNTITPKSPKEDFTALLKSIFFVMSNVVRYLLIQRTAAFE